MRSSEIQVFVILSPTMSDLPDNSDMSDRSDTGLLSGFSTFELISNDSDRFPRLVRFVG